ncbi:MAG: hypothetical protein ACD_20C00402G0003 [uncultured bacterium]|nr:MAG: hypothetical protein ACD_20C00402G0003 [uncultured bacterium]HBH17465.1 adenylate kinase [Cyanobacteria bacterium UBA9579]
MIKELIFLGAPASGKGTQTKMLARDLNIPHIDTGSMLRAAVAEGTEYGKIAKGFMEQGKLVTSEIVTGIVNERLHKPDTENGFILDGFPRNIEQAEALDKILAEINQNKDAKQLAINIDVPMIELVERIVNRRSCEKCGEIYNLKYKQPKIEGICDICGGKLVQRKDDVAEVAAQRIETYKNETEPLIQYYRNKGILVNIDGNRDINEIYADIKKAIS